MFSALRMIVCVRLKRRIRQRPEVLLSAECTPFPNKTTGNAGDGSPAQEYANAYQSTSSQSARYTRAYQGAAPIGGRCSDPKSGLPFQRTPCCGRNRPPTTATKPWRRQGRSKSFLLHGGNPHRNRRLTRYAIPSVARFGCPTPIQATSAK